MLQTTNGDPVINAILSNINPNIMTKELKKSTNPRKPIPKVKMMMTSSKKKLENFNGKQNMRVTKCKGKLVNEDGKLVPKVSCKSKKMNTRNNASRNNATIEHINSNNEHLNMTSPTVLQDIINEVTALRKKNQNNNHNNSKNRNSNNSKNRRNNSKNRNSNNSRNNNNSNNSRNNSNNIIVIPLRKGGSTKCKRKSSMKSKKFSKNSFNNLKATNNQRQIENMILRNIIKRRKSKRGKNNSLSKLRKMNNNSKTHKVITIPLPETNGPNIPKINVKKKCKVSKMPRYHF
jgi:hypothetical protein